MRKLVLAAAVVMGDYCFEDAKSGVKLHIALEGANIKVDAASPQGWVGVGVPRSADFKQMPGGNFYIGDGSTIYQRALTANVNGRPTQTVNHFASGLAFAANGQTSLSITRPLAPAGGNTIDASKPFNILWATGTKNGNGFDGVNYHGLTKGSFLVDPSKPNCGDTVQTEQVGKGKVVPVGKAGKAMMGKAGKMGKVATPGKMAKIIPVEVKDEKPEKEKKVKAEKTKVTVSNFVAYPGTENKFNVQGSVEMKFVGTSVSMKYRLENTDARCVRSTSAANSCGLHIHVGKTCSNNTEIAGHFYNNSTGVDPWLTAVYVSGANGAGKGETEVEYGYTFADSVGRAVIVHDQNGTRMACALIPAQSAKDSSKRKLEKLVEDKSKKDKKAKDDKKSKEPQEVVTVTNFVPYPGTAGRFNVTGSVVMKFVGTSVSMDYRLEKTDVRCVKASSAANSCGLHIHIGKTCSNATEIAGHYYDNSTGVDPWLTTVYVSDNKGTAVGAASVNYGYTYATSEGRSVIVHDQDGTRMACALIP